MATLGQLQKKAEDELGIEVGDTDILIASYLCHGMDSDEISKTLSVSLADLQELIESDEFGSIRQIVQLEIASSRVDIDGGWDSAELAALRRVNELITTDVGFMDIDSVLKIASVANKAERRNDKNSEVLNGQRGGLVTISLTQTFLTALQRGTKNKNTPVESGQIIEGDITPGIPAFAEINEVLNIDKAVKDQGKGQESLGTKSQGIFDEAAFAEGLGQ